MLFANVAIPLVITGEDLFVREASEARSEGQASGSATSKGVVLLFLRVISNFQ